jgi:CRISPR-associated exonuclease Cas4
MPYDNEDFLTISGLQHFTFCSRQWALIFIECIWDDNTLTASGTLMHERVHNPLENEKRGNLITARDMPVFSHELRVRGKCDVVEFCADNKGVSVSGENGLWLPRPVEYKRGRPKKNDSDRLQLCAQAMCLEEMLLCPPIETAYLYYGETRRREAVSLNTDLRERVKESLSEMHELYIRRHTPRVKQKKECVSCSLKDYCLPKLPIQSVRTYIDRKLGETP